MPFFRRICRVGIAHLFEALLHARPANSDFGNALLFLQPVRRLMQCFVERSSPSVTLGAVVQQLEKRKRRKRFLRNRRDNEPVLLPVAAGLHDQNRASGSAKLPDILDPIGQGLIAEGNTVEAVLVSILGLENPDEHENRPAAQKQRVGTVIDILPSEIPDLQPQRRSVLRWFQGRGRHQDSMGRGDRVIKRLMTQPAANLGLSDAAVAEDHELDVAHFLASTRDVFQMSTERIEAVAIWTL